jgi:hypothetical protein
MELLTRFYKAFESVFKFITDLIKLAQPGNLFPLPHRCASHDPAVFSTVGFWKMWTRASTSTKPWRTSWQTKTGSS